MGEKKIEYKNSFNYLICRGLHKPHPFPHQKVWDVKTSGDTVQKMSSIVIELINKKLENDSI